MQGKIILQVSPDFFKIFSFLTPRGGGGVVVVVVVVSSDPILGKWGTKNSVFPIGKTFK